MSRSSLHLSDSTGRAMRSSSRGPALGLSSTSRSGSGMNTTKTYPASKKHPNEDSLEKEYIYNLQQQVYLYELELQFLRDKAKTRGPPLKSRATETRDELELAEASTLDDAMYSLKKKYVEQKKLHEREIFELRQQKDTIECELAELRERCASRESDNLNLTEELEHAKAAREVLQSSTFEEIVMLQKTLEEKQLEIETLSDTITSLRLRREEDSSRIALIEEDKLETQRENALLKSELEKGRNRLSNLEHEHESLQSQLEQLQSTTKSKTEEELTEDNRKLQNEKRSLEIQVKRFQLEMEQMNEARKIAEEDLQRYMHQVAESQSKQAELSIQLKDTQRELQELHQKWDASSAERLSFSDQIRDFDLEKQSVQEEIASLRHTIESLQKRIDETERVLASVQEDKNLLRTELDKKKEFYANQDQSNTLLRVENRQLSESLSQEIHRREEAENHLQEANIDRARLRTSNNQLETKLATSKLIENLKLEEFQSLMSTNLQVASNIQALMSGLSDMTSSREESSGSVDALLSD